MSRVVVLVTIDSQPPEWVRDSVRERGLALWGARDWLEEIIVDAGSVTKPTLAHGANWLHTLKPYCVVIDYSNWQTRTNKARPGTFDNARRLHLGRRYMADLVRLLAAKHAGPVPIVYFHSRMTEAEKKSALLMLLGLPVVPQ